MANTKDPKKTTTQAKPKKLSVKALGSIKAGAASSSGTGGDDSAPNDYVGWITPVDVAGAKLSPKTIKK